jgi:hypothetical protein
MLTAGFGRITWITRVTAHDLRRGLAMLVPNPENYNRDNKREQFNPASDAVLHRHHVHGSTLHKQMSRSNELNVPKYDDEKYLCR